MHTHKHTHSNLFSSLVYIYSFFFLPVAMLVWMCFKRAIQIDTTNKLGIRFRTFWLGVIFLLMLLVHYSGQQVILAQHSVLGSISTWAFCDFLTADTWSIEDFQFIRTFQAVLRLWYQPHQCFRYTQFYFSIKLNQVIFLLSCIFNTFQLRWST